METDPVEEVSFVLIRSCSHSLNWRRYQKDLVAATERQQQLQRDKTQVELDWQRRHESVERNQYERAEGLVKSLTQARDEVRTQPHFCFICMDSVTHEDEGQFEDL